MQMDSLPTELESTISAFSAEEVVNIVAYRYASSGAYVRIAHVYRTNGRIEAKMFGVSLEFTPEPLLIRSEKALRALFTGPVADDPETGLLETGLLIIGYRGNSKAPTHPRCAGEICQVLDGKIYFACEYPEAKVENNLSKAAEFTWAILN